MKTITFFSVINELIIIYTDNYQLYFIVELTIFFRKPQSNFEDIIPKIPVQPISYATAKIILMSLGGPEIPLNWREGAILSTGTINGTRSQDPIKTYSPYLQHLGGEFSNDSLVTSVRLRTHNLLRERRITNVHAWLPCQDASK